MVTTAAPGQVNWLAQTKFAPPLLRNDVVKRPRLNTALCNAVCSRSLTLVSAPAGSGKTTLLAAMPQACPNVQVAWISLDEDDNDLVHFLAALVAALSRLNPDCGINAGALLATISNPAAEARRVIGVLINDVLEYLPDPFVLVMDDLHVITDQAVHAALEYLLDRLPAHMHIVLATRHDPPLNLAKLRVRRQLAELRLAELRFTLEEAYQFLNETLGLNLPLEQVLILEQRTEGWAAGIGLLVSSLDPESSSTSWDTFINHLAHTDRFVFDFLVEEVLHNQEPDVRRFLLQTSILAELTPALCEAVTGASNATAILQELYRRNLFMVAVDVQNNVYRYHDLFRDFLRQRLLHEMPEQIDELHRRAAPVETVYSRTLRHYLEAEMWDDAVATIEQWGEQLLRQGSVDILRYWISMLPTDVRDSRPRLLFLLGACAWLKWDLNTAIGFLEGALAGFEANRDEVGKGEALTYLAGCLSMRGDFKGAHVATQQALACTVSPANRVQLLAVSAWEAMTQGNWQQCNADLDEALALAESCNDPRMLHSLAIQLHSPFIGLPGGLERFERFCRLIGMHLDTQGNHLEANNPMKRNGWEAAVQAALQTTSQVHEVLVHVRRGRIAEAIAAGEKAVSFSEQFGGLMWVIADLGVSLPVCYALQGDFEKSNAAFEQFFQFIEQPAAKFYVKSSLPGYLYFLGRVHLMQGQFEEAQQVLNQIIALEKPDKRPYATVVRLMLQASLAIAEKHFEEAENLLLAALEMQEKLQFTIIFSDARILLGYLYQQWQKPQEALAVIRPLLLESEQNNTPGVFLWEGKDVVVPVLKLAIEKGVHVSFAKELLESYEISAETPGSANSFVAVAVPGTGETLTPREVEILLLIANGDSNQDIAQKLVISLHTVKRHVAHLLEKLDVDSRTQAAARARELQLV